MESGINESIKSEMRKTYGWIMFYAILFLIGAVALFIVGIFFFGESSYYFVDSSVVGGVMLLVAGLVGFMAVLLLRYANLLKSCAETGDIKLLEEGFVSYRTYFVISGIATILSAAWTLYGYVQF